MDYYGQLARHEVVGLDLLGYSIVCEPRYGATILLLDMVRLARATMFNDYELKFAAFVSQHLSLLRDLVDFDTSEEDWTRMFGNLMVVVKYNTLYYIGGWYWAPKLF